MRVLVVEGTRSSRGASRALNNVLVYVDPVLFTGIDLSLARSAVGAAAMVALVYGLIWEASA